MGTQKNRIIETVLLSTQNTCLIDGLGIISILGEQTILIWTYEDYRFKMIVHYSKLKMNSIQNLEDDMRYIIWMTLT